MDSSRGLAGSVLTIKVGSTLVGVTSVFVAERVQALEKMMISRIAKIAKFLLTISTPFACDI
jgi:hypothetical protein